MAPAAPDDDRHDEQRAAPRVVVLLRAVKVTCESGEYLCVLRDVSNTGVNLQTFHPLPAQGELTLELSNGDRHAIERVWERDGRAGLRFHEPGHVQRIVACASPFPRRAMRLALGLPCDIVMADREFPATLCNLSQHGAMFRSDKRFPTMQQLAIRMRGLAPLDARIRWRKHDRHGVCFQRPFAMSELAAIGFNLQRQAARSENASRLTAP